MLDYQNSFSAYPDILSISQLREMLGIGKSTAYSLILHNQIKSLKIGRIYKVPKQSVIDYINQQQLAKK